MSSFTDTVKPTKFDTKIDSYKPNVSVRITEQNQIRDEKVLEKLPCPQHDYLYSWKIFSLLYYGWLTPLLNIGYKQPLQLRDLWDVCPQEKAQYCDKKFTLKWEQEKIKAAKLNQQPNLLKVIVRLIGIQFLVACVLYGYSTFDTLIGPQILKKLTEYSIDASKHDVSPLDGYQWALYLFGSSVVSAVTRCLSLHLTVRLFIRIRNMLVIALYKKSLRIPMGNRNDGKLNNLMSSDTQKIVEFTGMVHNLISAPIIIAVGIYQLWAEVNWPGLLTLAVVFGFFPVAAVLMGKSMKFQIKAAKETDNRITLVNEIIQGIRVIKLNAWVEPFLKTLEQARQIELHWLKRSAWLKSITFGVLMLVPLLTTIVIFGAYAGDGGDMSPTIVFTTLSLVNIIKFPFSFLPLALAQFVQTLVAIKRIGDFLTLPEINDAQRVKLDRVGIEMVDSQFAWSEEVARDHEDEEKDKAQPATKTKAKLVSVKPKDSAPRPPILTNIDISLHAAHLALVIGPVASGKSSLLFGMLGEIEQRSGKTSIGGNVAYVPQTAFIINATVRENITFGQTFDSMRYASVIHACALTSDLELLPNGDFTEIGERGINLSGGQKQRISLARAAYNDKADVVLLDDPLSAVDNHVAHHIFAHCINGIMKDRLRVLVTHSMAFVDHADTILLIKQSNVKDSYTIKTGTPASLREDDKEFVALLARYNAGVEEMKSESQDGKQKISKKDVQSEKSSQKKNKKEDLTETEEREEGAVGWNIYLRYLRAGGNRFFFAFVPLMFLLAQATQTGSDFVLSKWSNDMSDNEHSVGFWLAIYGGLVAASTLFTLLRTSAVAMFGILASRRLHHELSRSVLGKTIGWFDKTPAGRIVSRFSRDFFMIDMALAMIGELAISMSLSVLGIFVVIAIIVPIALALFAVLAVLYFYTTEIYRRSNRELARLESISRTPIYTQFGETLSGTASIRALLIQDMYLQENIRRLDVNTRALYFSRVILAWLQLRLGVIGAIVLGGSAVLAVASPHIDGTVSAGNFGLLVSYALNLSNLLSMTVILSSQVEAMMNSVERVDHYIIPQDQEIKVARNHQASQLVQQSSWPSQGRIQVQNLQFRYRPDLDYVLNGINLDIPAGAKVGIVGRTGSGKSSLLVALFRLVDPCGGSISIDGIDLADISLHDIRSRVSIIPQDAFLFHGSLRYNLDPHSQHSDEEVWQSLEYVQLRGFVERLPSQLETLVAEAGGNLSNGQRQLLCIARALLRKPKVICLDEATSGVDIETDALIQNVVRTQFKGCTVLTIAHRLNTILDYDMVVVLDRGNVVEVGKPHELMRADGLFASMLHDKDNDIEA